MRATDRPSPRRYGPSLPSETPDAYVERLEIDAEESFDSRCSVIEHLLAEPRINADPERLVHYDVGILERTANAIFSSDHVGLTREISGEKQTGADLVLIEITEQVDS